MTAIEFDLDRYLRASKRLDLSQIAWEDIPQSYASTTGP